MWRARWCCAVAVRPNARAGYSKFCYCGFLGLVSDCSPGVDQHVQIFTVFNLGTDCHFIMDSLIKRLTCSLSGCVEFIAITVTYQMNQHENLTCEIWKIGETNKKTKKEHFYLTRKPL